MTPYKKYGRDKLYQDFLKQLEESQKLFCGFLYLKKNIKRNPPRLKTVEDVVIQQIDTSLS